MALNKKPHKKDRERGGDEHDKEFEQKLIDLARVTRVTKGGKRMSFRATVVMGDRKGSVSYGIGKAGDVSQAISKATKQSKKNMLKVVIVNETIPHAVTAKVCSAKILMKPAAKGKGVKAGGVMRVVLSLAGIPNVTGKVLGSGNKINNLYATFEALKKLRTK